MGRGGDFEGVTAYIKFVGLGLVAFKRYLARNMVTNPLEICWSRSGSF